MFEAGNPVGMFAELGDSRLTHPNPNSRWKAKHYEMAGKIIVRQISQLEIVLIQINCTIH